ncbi:MAG TPA: lysylphosphatidylglycerol synthase domain-containing protein [Caulobacteraceae bacterium]
MIEQRGRARASAIVIAMAGALVAIVVIARFNFGAVLAAIRPIGATDFLVVIAAQLALFIPLGLAWWLAAPGQAAGRAPVFVWARLMREAASDVLPFSQLGGVVIAARAATSGGVTAAVAFGSSVVDISLEVVAQLLYTLIGIGLLVGHFGLHARGDRLLLPVLGGLTIAAAAVGGFILAQRRGFALIERLVQRMMPIAAAHAAAAGRAVEAAYGRPARTWTCLGLHVACWFGSAAGTWLILNFIGRPLPFLSVVAIESLLFAIRNAAFIVPSGLGVQEGAYALLGPLFGLPAEVALALSLLKRGRDIIVGIPVLLSWQIVEAQRPLRRE